MSQDHVIEYHKPEQIEEPLTKLLLSGANRVIQQAVEAELGELLSSYEGESGKLDRAAMVRNRYLPEREVLTGIGPVSVKVPKVRLRTDEPVVFRSSLVPPYVRRAKTMDAALPWLYLKALAVLVGPEAKGLSPAVVSRLKATWYQEYEAWRETRLDRDRWVYLCVDGIYSGLRAEGQKLCALVVIETNERGRKRFLAIEDAVRESTQSWREVLLSLKGRGLEIPPEVAVGDGALGFWAALDEIYPGTRHQRCWVDKTANVLNALPKSVQAKAKSGLHEIWQAPTREDAQRAFDRFIEIYGPKYPKAAQCLVKDRDSLYQIV